MVNGRLTEFLREASNKRVMLGHWDCGLWLADWYMAATGKPDPASEFRGTAYDGRSVAMRVRSVVRTLRLSRRREPSRGDIGLVSLSRGHLVGGIFTGSRWCLICEDGGLGSISPASCRFIAWRIK